jgi:hypothetical protein
MIPRPRSVLAIRLCLAAGCLAAGLLTLTGCDPRQMAYFLQPFEPQIPAPGPELKGKRVVVIAKAVPGALYDQPTLDRELADEIASTLRSKVKKIDVVNVDKVYAWDQANPTWSDPAELAAAFKADMVIDLEVQSYQIQDPSSPGLFEGRSSVHVRVTERAAPRDDRGREIAGQPLETKVVYENDRETTFPVRGPIPASAEVTRSAFQNKFLKLVAMELSWYFVSHAPGDNIQDVRFE